MQGVGLLLLLVTLGYCSALRSSMRNVRGRDLTMMARKPIMAGNWKMNTDLEVSGSNFCKFCLNLTGMRQKLWLDSHSHTYSAHFLFYWLTFSRD